MTRILIVRGHLVTPWELAPWRELPERFEVRCLLTRSNRFETPQGLRTIDVRSLRDLLPAGRVGDLIALGVGDRYLTARGAFAWADVVHSEELGFWFAADAARRRQRGGRFRLVQTVWETLPLLSSYRNRTARRHRERVLAATDLFLPTTERSARALTLEGVGRERMRVCPPGIDIARFRAAVRENGAGESAAQHLIISPGRLVWEKGHQDVLRAVALLHRGEVRLGDGRAVRPQVRIVGRGPEEGRLRALAGELGLTGAVEIGPLAYDAMPGLFATGSAMVLASQPSATAGLHPFDIPRAFWEEQFGMVLAEAMAAGLSIVASSGGAVPEVLAGTAAQLVTPGDWIGLAGALAQGPLSRPPQTRVSYPEEIVTRYSTKAAAARLTSAYDALRTA